MVEPASSPLSVLETECRTLLLPWIPPGTLLTFERTRAPEFGELSCNVAMRLARPLSRNPLGLAEEIVAKVDLKFAVLVREIRAAKPGFINFYVHHDRFARLVVAAVRALGPAYGRPPDVVARHVVIEHTSVNPNKPWHIGHVRNAVLGDVLGRLFRFVGHDVEIQNYIDDTGKQVADMLFGLRFLRLMSADGNVAIPPGVKPDHYFGDAYVRINALAESKDIPAGEMEAGSAELMHARERGEYRELVHTIVRAQLETAWRLGIYYDLLSWEGDIVQAQLFEKAMTKLRASPHVFVQTEGRHAGCLVIEMGEFLPEGAGETADDHPTERVLIRSNGLPTYTAKDIAYHMWKYSLLDGDMLYALDTVQPNGEQLWSTSMSGKSRPRKAAGEVINLIDVRQSLPQQVVKAALQVTGFSEQAANHHHLAYGVVSPKGGKFSGRAGTEYSADSVLDAVVAAQYAMSQEKAVERGIQLPELEMRETSELVAVAALRYLMVRFDPLRNVSFTVDDVIDKNGVTGLYIQYAYARALSIFRKGGYQVAGGQASLTDPAWRDADSNLLIHQDEWALLMLVARFPVIVAEVVESLNLHTLADYAHALAEAFNFFYEHCPILHSDVPADLRAARLSLAAVTARTMQNVAGVLGLALPDRL